MSKLTAEKWQRTELFYRLERVGNPFTDISIRAEFTSPSGRLVVLPGFYAGDGIWKVRFAPDEPGEWSWRVILPGEIDSGSLVCEDAPAKGLLRADLDYPQRLRFQNGDWFFPLGSGTELITPPGFTDTDATEPTAASLEAWLEYLDLLNEHRINKLRLWLPPPGDTASALTPWRNALHGASIPLQFHLPYWDRLDRIIAAAAQRDIVVELVVLAEPPNAEPECLEFFAGYLLARTVSFWNVWYSVLISNHGSDAWLDRWISLFRSLDPYSHLLSAPVVPRGETEQSPLLTDIVHLSAEMVPEAGAKTLYSLWEAGRPCVVDDPHWVGSSRPTGDPDDPAMYAQERFWFWTVFASGGSPCRVAWQSWNETPSMDWIRCLAHFADQLQWWTLRPDPDAVAQATCQAYCAVSPTDIVLYCIGGGSGHKVVLRADPGNYLLRWFDPPAGEFVGEASGYSDGRLPLELPEFREDIALLIRRVVPPAIQPTDPGQA
ncbi:MAG: DUF5060 domain-containing protein [Armatimonadota bacterium]